MIHISFETFVQAAGAQGRTTTFVLGAPISGGFWAVSEGGLGWCAEGVPTRVEEDGAIWLRTV